MELKTALNDYNNAVNYMDKAKKMIVSKEEIKKIVSKSKPVTTSFLSKTNDLISSFGDVLLSGELNTDDLRSLIGSYIFKKLSIPENLKI